MSLFWKVVLTVLTVIALVSEFSVYLIELGIPSGLTSVGLIILILVSLFLVEGLIVTQVHWFVYMYTKVQKGVFIWIFLNAYMVYLSFELSYLGTIIGIVLITVVYWVVTDITVGVNCKDHLDRLKSIPKLYALLEKHRDSNNPIIKSIVARMTIC